MISLQGEGSVGMPKDSQRNDAAALVTDEVVFLRNHGTEMCSYSSQ